MDKITIGNQIYSILSIINHILACIMRKSILSYNTLYDNTNFRTLHEELNVDRIQ